MEGYSIFTCQSKGRSFFKPVWEMDGFFGGMGRTGPGEGGGGGRRSCSL